MPGGHLYPFPTMDHEDVLQLLISTVGDFLDECLMSRDHRFQQKEQCAERLAAKEAGGTDPVTEVRYADQAVLANLDWGIDALEEAIDTSNVETKLARLDYAEKMLRVCAMLDIRHKTGGVPNCYLSAWAHLNLSYLWKLRNNVRNSTLHILEMFDIDPFFSRVDFAPRLWKDLFLQHMSSISGWYSDARHKIVLQMIPDSSDLSFIADFDQLLNASVVFAMRPDQMEKMHELEKTYQESLDENTRLYARYYMDCLNFDPRTDTTEPPEIPSHELSHSVPKYINIGPVLSTGREVFSFPKIGDGATQSSRLNNTAPNISMDMKESIYCGIIEADEEVDGRSGSDDCDSPRNDDNKGGRLIPLRSSRINFDGMYSPLSQPSPSRSGDWSSKTRDRSTKSSSSPEFVSVKSNVCATAKLRDCIASAEKAGQTNVLSTCRRQNHPGSLSISSDNGNGQQTENRCKDDGDDDSNSSGLLQVTDSPTSRSRPPKDFVCPITGQIFSDPVTLETGQTYERRAIQEWLERGNKTCPITRQSLSASTLPKTNYVLKRLITSWREQLPDIAQEFSYSETPVDFMSPSSSKDDLGDLGEPERRHLSNPQHRSLDEHQDQKTKRFRQQVASMAPKSNISQAAVETVIKGLKPFVSSLCTSEDLQECEAAVLKISRSLQETKGDPAVHSYLAKPTITNGLVEILAASLNREVLRNAVYILSELINMDERVAEALTSIDSDFFCLASLLKNGLNEAAVLIYQLRPTFSQLSSNDFIPTLLHVIHSDGEDTDNFQLFMEPEDAAISMLEQILIGADENSGHLNAQSVISFNGIPALLKCMDKIERRLPIISILLCCIHADKSCRNLIAKRLELSQVLDLFHAGSDVERGKCTEFMLELVQADRRMLRNHVLQKMKDEGSFSTMHTLLVYLQMAPMEQQPAIASLLLQLDLLVDPTKMSIYREEAIETLIESLQKKEFPSSQMMALNVLLSLSGRLPASGKCSSEAWLLKTAGFGQSHDISTEAENERNHSDESAESDEEEKAATSWEKRVAFVLCNHEKGSIFRALEECLKSNSIEMARICLIIATWLTHMLLILPDTGVKSAARKCFLDEFINVLQSSRNVEEKILATLAIRTFINDPAALEELGTYAKCIYKNLRKLKRHSVIANDILKALINLTTVNARELWSCSEVVEVESCSNGEVLSLIYLKGRLVSGHSDGTIKVWDVGKKVLRLVQEVREHTKAVTCLCAAPSEDRLYSGSIDKSIRIWAIRPDEIHCIQVHDVKEAVLALTAKSNVACFISQGTGVNVYNWSGSPKHINFNKTAKCLAMAGDKLYCGCSGCSIQEVDLKKLTSCTFYSGARKLLGKQTVQSMVIQGNLLYACGSSIDGTAGKVFSLPTKVFEGCLTSGIDIQQTVVNNDFIFTAMKCGNIEVWLKERLVRVASLTMGMRVHSKTTSLAADKEGRMLFAGSSEGRILAWAID
ncbi:hypothetical protein MLD38_029894 [Melastoma candidum]|uniref:Uncharacterized protein n=1 Tax=Melastoma candidum TaxID=119954 RepID=A0ACB9MM40_9MYRT|nr:hypothetical protein MLD38_029894 [Melastoma candidum]